MKLHCTERGPYLAAALFLFGPSLHPATAQLLGPEFQVNSYTTDHQWHPAVAADGAGTFVVIWESYLQDGWNEGVFGQRFDSAGSRLGGEFQVNTYTTLRQTYPAVAKDDLGGFVVVWSSQAGVEHGVFGQRFDPAGNRLGSEFLVNSNSTGQQSQLHPAMALDGTGGFVVVWESYDWLVSDGGVIGQRFDATGAKLGTEFQVNTYTTGAQMRPAVAAESSGAFVVVWESLFQDGSDYGVFGQRFDSAGGAMGNEFRVNSYTTNAQQFPAVAATHAGNFVVVWQSIGQDGESWGVFGQAFSSAGGAVGSEFQVNTQTLQQQKFPAVAAGSTGGFVVTWWSYYVFGQRLDPAGSRSGSEFRVNTYSAVSNKYPAVAAGDSGRFVVVWPSWHDGSGYGVFGQRIGAPVFTHGFEANPPFWSNTSANMCLGFCDSVAPSGCSCEAFCLTNFNCCLDTCSTCGYCGP